MEFRSATYLEYLESGRWYCADSPIEAHCWKHIRSLLWKCKYCKSETRRFKMSWHRNQYMEHPLDGCQDERGVVG